MDKLKCWSKDCPETFDTFTELSNHHLQYHQRPLPVGKPLHASAERVAGRRFPVTPPTANGTHPESHALPDPARP